MDLEINLAAIENKKYPAKIKFIAPKGIEEAGAVQFKIEADVYIDQEYFVRAGYSANASIIIEKKDSVNCISEALIQYEKESKKPYVEIETNNQEFKKQEVSLGLSDGINVEVLSGIQNNDKIKIWNKTEPNKRNERWGK